VDTACGCDRASRQGIGRGVRILCDYLAIGGFLTKRAANTR